MEEIINGIKRLLRTTQSAVVQNALLREPSLLKHIRFAESLAFNSQCHADGLFGYPGLKTDFVPSSRADVVIEVKRIGFTRNAAGDRRENECDLKNGLAQVLEQAFCRHSTHAILVVLDGGRAADRPWSSAEKRFVSFFCNNSLGINLSVLRASYGNNQHLVRFDEVMRSSAAVG